MIRNTREERPIRAIAQNIQRRILLIGAALALVLSSSFVAGRAFATPGSGITPTPITAGVLPEPVRVKLQHGGGFGNGTTVSNINIVKYTVAPGGYFGWHQHGGPVWVVVSAGTLTYYEAGDPTCTGQAFAAGSAFLDPGDHTHNARNEAAVPVEVYAVFMLPAGGPVRVDMPNPGVCPF
jgi:quercetin dioxygenase-like cupin family protein